MDELEYQFEDDQEFLGDDVAEYVNFDEAVSENEEGSVKVRSNFTGQDHDLSEASSSNWFFFLHI
jgi:hypothetical protein